MPGPLIVAGTGHVLFAYDVGLGVRLLEAARLLSGWSLATSGETAVSILLALVWDLGATAWSARRRRHPPRSAG